MPEPAMLDYFYGDEAEQYTFYRIPKVLFTDPAYRRISSDAKILYGLMDFMASVFTPVSGHNLIAAFLAGPHDGRDNHAILFDALDCLPHFLIVPHLKRVVREWVKVRQRQTNHHFLLGWLLGRRGGFLSSPGR